jgi:hypothetical protein
MPVCHCPIEDRGFHCAACHVSFSGLKNFDKHQLIRSGRTVCRDPAGIGLVVLREIGPPGDRRPVWGRPVGDRPPSWREKSPA